MFRNREEELEATLRGALVLLSDARQMIHRVCQFPEGYELEDELDVGMIGIREVLEVVPAGKPRDIEGRSWADSPFNVRTVRDENKGVCAYPHCTCAIEKLCKDALDEGRNE